MQKFLAGAVLIGSLILLESPAFALEPQSNNNSQITQEQCKEFKKAHKGHRHKHFNPEKVKERMQIRLSKLVKEGKLSQEKADKVADYYYNFAKERKAKWSKLKGMEPEEKRAYIQKLKQEKRYPLKELVAKGIITTEEAEAIKQAMPHCKCKR